MIYRKYLKMGLLAVSLGAPLAMPPELKAQGLDIVNPSSLIIYKAKYTARALVSDNRGNEFVVTHTGQVYVRNSDDPKVEAIQDVVMSLAAQGLKVKVVQIQKVELAPHKVSTPDAIDKGFEILNQIINGIANQPK